MRSRACSSAPGQRRSTANRAIAIVIMATLSRSVIGGSEIWASSDLPLASADSAISIQLRVSAAAASSNGSDFGKLRLSQNQSYDIAV